MNIASPLAPISLIMVCVTTSPFWTSIIAHFMLREIMVPLEIVSMLICFGMVVVIAMQRRKEEVDDSESEDL